MMENAFIGLAQQPSEQELRQALGPAFERRNALLDDLAHEPEITERQWHSYSKKAGWSMRLKAGKRNVVYLLPAKGGMMAALVFGDRAIDAIRNGGFPKTLMDQIDSAKRYAEGTGIRIEVKTARDAALIRKLVAIKLEY